MSKTKDYFLRTRLEEASIQILKKQTALLETYGKFVKLERRDREFEKYKEDPVAFIKNELWIFNPELHPSIIPFNLWSYQQKFIKKIVEKYRAGEHLINEKTRQMGFSWLYMAFLYWAIKFDEDFSGLVLSYKEDLVDDGGERSTWHSLLGKLRFMHVRCSFKGPEEDIYTRHLTIVNRKTESFIKGSTTTSDAGRGGSYKFVLWDETAATPRSEDIWASIEPSCSCIHLNSTVRGKGNVFSRLRWSEESNIEVITSHWSLHPERSKEIHEDEKGKLTSPWYEAECRTLTPRQVAQELDINYEESAEGLVYTKFNIAGRFIDIEYPELLEDGTSQWYTVLGWDLGVSDETFITVGVKDNWGKIGILDSYYNVDQEIRFYIQLIEGDEPNDINTLSWKEQDRAMAFAHRAKERQYASRLQVVGPDARNRGIQSKHSVMQQMKTASSLKRGYRDLQVRIVNAGPLERIELCKKVMDPVYRSTRRKAGSVPLLTKNDELWFYVEKHQKGFIERIQNYVWTQDREHHNKQIPKHDWASHAADSVGYLIAWMVHLGRRVQGKPVGV